MKLTTEQKNDFVKCERCFHTWRPRRLPVIYCAACKSSLWNKPRKYQSSHIKSLDFIRVHDPNIITAKRTAPTGRAAAAKKAISNLRNTFADAETRRQTLETKVKNAISNYHRIEQQMFDVKREYGDVSAERTPFAWKRWQEDYRSFQYALSVANDEIAAAKRELANFEQSQPKQNPLKTFCADCHTTKDVFLSPLGANLCPTCETNRQQPIFQI